MTKPEPSEETLRSDGERPPLRLKKSSKNSSNGAPFGTFGRGTPSGPLRVWLVEMLTTASISFSATGATLAGPRVCELAGVSIKTRAAAARVPRRASCPNPRPSRDVLDCIGPLMPNSPDACLCSNPKGRSCQVEALASLELGSPHHESFSPAPARRSPHPLRPPQRRPCAASAQASARPLPAV